jgi:hypothetical protein
MVVVIYRESNTGVYIPRKCPEVLSSCFYFIFSIWNDDSRSLYFDTVRALCAVIALRVGLQDEISFKEPVRTFHHFLILLRAGVGDSW